MGVIGEMMSRIGVRGPRAGLLISVGMVEKSIPSRPTDTNARFAYRTFEANVTRSLQLIEESLLSITEDNAASQNQCSERIDMIYKIRNSKQRIHPTLISHSW